MGVNILWSFRRNPGWQNIFKFCAMILLIVTISCNSQGQSNKENKVQSNERKAGAIRLKYSTGVRSVLEDSKGNIWFGSYNEGVCLLHDGELRYFTKENGLSDNQVRSIYEDKKGLIWFECGIGISYYDGQKMAVYEARDFSSKNQWKLTGGDLWFKTDETVGYNKLEGSPGVYHYDGLKMSYRAFPVTVKPENNFSYSISTPFVKGKNGMVWIGAYNAVIGYNGRGFKIIDNESLDLTKEKRSLHIRSILEDSKGNLWIGNNGIGVFKYDGKETIDFTTEQKLKKSDTKGNSLERIFSIGEDKLGNIWFGTIESGVWRYDGSSLKNYTKADGLESNHIWLIYKSKQGELWFGGADPSGVYIFNGSRFERKF